MAPADSTHSSYRAVLLEHLFIGEVQRHLWMGDPVLMEVLKPQVDDAGYDLVLECGRVRRHVQLKSSFRGSRTSVQKVHTKLAEKPSGCVIWLRFDRTSLDLGPFLWFGGRPRKRLPSLSSFRVARHTKGDAAGHKAKRPRIRCVPKGSFVVLESIEEVVERLFGAEALRS